MAKPRVYNRYHKDAPPGAVYIGRGTPWGNKFPITPEMPRLEAIERFKCEQLPHLDLRPLIGLSVVCSCYPAPCHGNPLIEAVAALGRRMLVYGGRAYDDRRRLHDVLDAAHERDPITVIIEGEASGADRLARLWAESRGIFVDPYPADWDNVERPGAVVKRNRRGKLYDAAAGPFRNEQMLRDGCPDGAIGFPSMPMGKGTLDMTTRCLEYGITPQIVR